MTLAVSFDFLTDASFWVRVLALAGTYWIFALGLQLNVGFTGVVNFGQAGFMAIGGYTMALLNLKADWPFGLALIGSIAVAVIAGLIIGLPSLRLRADYLAIVTIAFAEMIRLSALNATGLTGGPTPLGCVNQGGADLSGIQLCYNDTWKEFARDYRDSFDFLNLDDPLLAVLTVAVLVVALLLTVLLSTLTKTPWGRVLRAVREDEDAARALGKNAFAYKLQSLAIAAALGAVSGWFLALNLQSISPRDFEPIVTFLGFAVLVLGGLATWWGVPLGALLFYFLYEGLRAVDLPIADEKIAPLRFIFLGALLILLMRFRPQGIFGRREEMVLTE